MRFSGEGTSRDYRFIIRLWIRWSLWSWFYRFRWISKDPTDCYTSSSGLKPSRNISSRIVTSSLLFPVIPYLKLANKQKIWYLTPCLCDPTFYFYYSAGLWWNTERFAWNLKWNWLVMWMFYINSVWDRSFSKVWYKQIVGGNVILVLINCVSLKSEIQFNVEWWNISAM